MRETNLPLFQHQKRPSWGVALLTWERSGKRGYLFDDGTLRIIGESFWGLLSRVEAVDEATLEAFTAHLATLNESETRNLMSNRRSAEEDSFSIEEQARLFLGEFPDGFSGTAWRRHQRGEDAPRRLKRHRDPVLAEAREQLAPDRLENVLKSGAHAEFWGGLCGALRRSDLVSARELRVLGEHAKLLARGQTEALRAALHDDVEAGPGSASFGVRFARWAAELARGMGGSPSWALVTAPLALWSPAQHLSVHPTSLRRQGRWMGQKAVKSRAPNPQDYARALELANGAAEQLSRLGLPPCDLMDVADFVRATTSPLAQQRLLVLRQSEVATANGVSGPDSDREAA